MFLPVPGSQLLSLSNVGITHESGRFLASGVLLRPGLPPHWFQSCGPTCHVLSALNPASEADPAASATDVTAGVAGDGTGAELQQPTNEGSAEITTKEGNSLAFTKHSLWRELQVKLPLPSGERTG